MKNCLFLKINCLHKFQAKTEMCLWEFSHNYYRWRWKLFDSSKKISVTLQNQGKYVRNSSKCLVSQTRSEFFRGNTLGIVSEYFNSFSGNFRFSHLCLAVIWGASPLGFLLYLLYFKLFCKHVKHEDIMACTILSFFSLCTCIRF
jgi:hypothetical protein